MNTKKVELNTLKDRLEAAKFLHRSGELIKAEEEYRKILTEDPTNGEAHHLMGLLALQMGKFDVAETFFKTAIEIDGEKPEYVVNLGVLHYLRRDFEAAKEKFKKGIEMDPTYMEAHANLGKIFAEEGEMEEARRHLVKAVNLGDRDESTLITLAEVNLRLGLYDRAESVCKDIFDLGIDKKQVYDILIDAMLKQNKVDEVIPFLEIALNRYRGEEKYKKMLEELYKKTGFSEN